MLISKPKQQQDLFAISNIGFIINSIQINFDELPIIYFANTIDNLKQSNNYDKWNYFFNDSKFSFNDQFMTLDNIKKQINLLDMVTESYIKRLIEKYDSNRIVAFIAMNQYARNISLRWTSRNNIGKISCLVIATRKAEPWPPGNCFYINHGLSVRR